MENTLENEMLDAAVCWCCSNGINVLEPEQLASLVNSLYVTVCDAALDTAQPVHVNAMLVEALEKTLQRALKWFESIDKTACESEDSINKSRKLFAVARDARIAMYALKAAPIPQQVAESAPSSLPLLSEAFRTTESNGASSDYRMVFKFKDLASLHSADDEWRKFKGAA